MKKVKLTLVIIALVVLIALGGCGKHESEPTPNLGEATRAIEYVGIDNIDWMSANKDTIMLSRYTPVSRVEYQWDGYFEIYDSEFNRIKNIEHKLLIGEWLAGLSLNPDNSYWVLEDDLISFEGRTYRSYLRLFSSEGDEILTIDVSDERGRGFKSELLGTDLEGNAYLYSVDTLEYYTRNEVPIRLYIVDQTGTIIKQIDDKFSDPIRMTTLDDGRVILFIGLYGVNVYELTADEPKLLHTFDEDVHYRGIFAYQDNILFLYDGFHLLSFNLETFESSVFASLLDVQGYQLDSIVETPDGEIYGKLISRLVRFVKSDGQAQADERTVITVAAYGALPNYINGAVIEFNRKSTDYKLAVVDYSRYDTEDDIYGSVFKLNLDIMAGKAPDIYLWNFKGNYQGFSHESFASKGIYADWGEFLDSDADLSQESFLPNLIEALKTENGEIFELPIEFAASVIACRRSEIPIEQWTLEEFLAIQAKRPEAIAAFGIAPEMLLSVMFQYSSEDFVDWNAGTCNFETEYFISLLNFIRSQKIDPQKQYYALAHNNIAAGISYLYPSILGQTRDIQASKATFAGDDVSFICFPTTQGRGNSFRFETSFSISKLSEHKEACWEFLRQFYTSEYQLANALFFPSNMTALDYRLNNPNEYIDGESGTRIEAGDEIFEIVLKNATDDEIEQVKELIYSLDRVHRQNNIIRDIIYGSVGAFLNDQASAEQTAKIIQNRVSIYLAEQS